MKNQYNDFGRDRSDHPSSRIYKERSFEKSSPKKQLFSPMADLIGPKANKGAHNQLYSPSLEKRDLKVRHINSNPISKSLEPNKGGNNEGTPKSKVAILLPSLSPMKLQILHNQPSPRQYNRKRIDFQNEAMLESPRSVNTSKTLNADLIQMFDDKYALIFSEGYTNKIIEKCVELLNNEDNPSILENILPGRYSDLIPKTTKSSQGIINTINSQSYQLLKSNVHVDIKGSFLPQIKSPQTTKTLAQNSETRTISSERHPSRLDDFQPSGVNNSGMSSIRSQNPLRLTLEDLKQVLMVKEKSSNRSTLILLGAKNKTVPVNFGFCEVNFEEGKGIAANIPRLFICKPFRKLKMVELITLKLVDYLFRKYSLEKITIDFLVNNSMQKEIQTIGFKLQKVDNVNFRYKTYVLRKADFNALMSSLVSDNELNVYKKANK